jgi:hypothetical protein
LKLQYIPKLRHSGRACFSKKLLKSQVFAIVRVIRTSLEKLRHEAAAENRKRQQKIRNSRISGSRSVLGSPCERRINFSTYKRHLAISNCRVLKEEYSTRKMRSKARKKEVQYVAETAFKTTTRPGRAFSDLRRSKF